MIRIKYCGLTTSDDVKHAAEAGIDAVGFVFVEKSKRYIAPEQAKTLIQQAKHKGLLTVALFANQEASLVNKIIDLIEPQVLQFHGSETAEFCEQFDWPYWKAVPMKSDIDFLAYIAIHPRAEMFLLDAFGEQQCGGSGESFQWFEFPEALKSKLILAGGINEQNVEQAIKVTGAEFIDTSSGIEEIPGVKSKQKMIKLAAKIKSLSNNKIVNIQENTHDD
ncbi:MAG: phosphoribosylanthranilate isomerase [Marinicella sp.]|nr:phosphoribosylanthranilate isomerase [Xanthomonadales bacterium]